MLDLIKFLDARLKEPSTWAGIATLLGTLHVSVDAGLWSTVTIWGTGAAAVLAIVLSEIGTKTPVAIAADALQQITASLRVLAAPPPGKPASDAPADAPAPAVKAAAALVLLLGGGLALNGCTAQQVQNAGAIEQAAAPAVGTLLQLAALNNATVSGLVMRGQPFCKKADGTIVAVGAVTGNPIVGALAGTVPYGALALSVVNATDEGVGKLCAMVEAVPAPPPSNVPTASVPVAVVPAAAAAAALKPAA